MSSPDLVIVETGIANTASVRGAFDRCGVASVVTGDARAVEMADLLVLPGVGAFGPGMSRLIEAGVADVIRRRVDDGRPTLAICLGLQLLCVASDEAPGVAGLGVLDGTLTAFPDDVRRPQLGWNRVEPDPSCTLLTAGFAYFANSYRLRTAPAGWSAAYGEHAGPFVAGLERGAVLACQFHPELSHDYGDALLRRWLARSLEVASC